MTAKETYLLKEIKKSFKDFTFEGLQSLVNELEKDNDIDLNIKKDVFEIFFKKCATKLRKNRSVEFTFGGHITDIFESTEGGWYITLYPENAQKDENGYYNPEDEVDGGLCDGSAKDAITYMIFI